MIHIGIDPGKSGYLAMTGTSDGPLLFPCPVVKTGSGSKRAFDVPGMYALVAGMLADHPHQDVGLCVIEKAQPMPTTGSMGNYSTGYGYGLWRMALAACAIPVEELAPVTWKRAMGVCGTGNSANGRRKDSKRRSIEKALALFPGVNLLPSPRCRKQSDDMAEAILLAEVARRRYSGQA